MAEAPRSFRRAAKKQAKKEEVFAFSLVWEADQTEEQIEADEEPEIIRSDTFHAHRPSEERLFLVAAMLGDEDATGSEATAIMDLLRSSLPEKEYRLLRQRLADPDDSVSLEMLTGVMEWLMEAWSHFPTEPSSGSANSQTSTGTKSTGRVHGKGSTRST